MSLNRRKHNINKPFSLLVKPASADCNLMCEYCFYLKKAALYPDTKEHRMSDETLEHLIAGFMGTEQSQYAFGWQGGEPTLMGVDFFKNVIRLQKKYGKPGAAVANGLQTNGMLIDDALAAHLAEYHFLVGVSLDGPPQIHNRYRVTATGGKTHNRVLRGIDVLRKHRVEFNILVLVNSENVTRPADVYDYLVDNDFNFHQYIPCVEWDEKGNPTPCSITGRQWGNFLCGLFDRWVQKNHTRKVSIRNFDSILNYLVTGTRNVCTMGTSCNDYFMVEHNGDVYPCDFFADPGLKLGNIHEHNWHELQVSKQYREFGLNKSRYGQDCRVCEFVDLCNGDCPKHRYGKGQDPMSISCICHGLKQFYRHTLDDFTSLANSVRQEQAQIMRSEKMVMKRAGQAPSGKKQKIGPNTPCPCGSGKKYKKCCRSRDQR